MNKKDITSKDLLLCFLYSPGMDIITNEPIIGRTKLTKMMYLFEKEIFSSFFKDNVDIILPSFEPYYFGPFSRQLFEDLAFFQSIGMIEAEETNIPLSFLFMILLGQLASPLCFPFVFLFYYRLPLGLR